MTTVELRPVPKRKFSKSELEKLKIRYQILEDRVDAAIKNGKIFKVVGGWNVPQIKYHLSKRGFIEVIDNVFRNRTTKESDMALLEKAEDSNIYEQALLSKMLGVRRPKFVWTEQPHFYYPYNFATMMNKIHVEDMDFWVKDGLCKTVQKINGRAKRHSEALNYPRSYNLSEQTQIEEFYNDYRLTVATNFLRYLNSCRDIMAHFCTSLNSDDENTDANVFEHVPIIDIKILDYIFKVVLEHIEALSESKRQNPEYDEDQNPYEEEENEFQDLTVAYTQIVMQRNGKFWINNTDATIDDYIVGIMSVSETIQRYWPWRHHDGYKNIWLVKPTTSGEGQGIKLFDSPEKITNHIRARSIEKFIVQKYIERPLLIYNTKFDLRQYLLVSIDETHFYAWSHPVCSVKLASQEFNLDKYDECIHLTNASIQQKYFHQNSNENLPNHHMWNLGTFILYLENEYGKGDVWDKSIFPEINRSLRKIAHSMAYHTELTPGRFEIFGCDWIITEDFKPYLLEINRPPCLGIYSPVSVSVCGKICEDLVKVVVDRMMNGEEDTGEFEIIYQAKIDDLKRGSLRRASTVSMASDKGSHIFNRRFSML